MESNLLFPIGVLKTTITLSHADSSLTDAAKSGCSKEKTQTMAWTIDAIQTDSGPTERHATSSRGPSPGTCSISLPVLTRLLAPPHRGPWTPMPPTIGFSPPCSASGPLPQRQPHPHEIYFSVPFQKTGSQFCIAALKGPKTKPFAWVFRLWHGSFVCGMTLSSGRWSISHTWVGDMG